MIYIYDAFMVEKRYNYTGFL